MQLDRDTLRKLRGLIIFTLVILVGLWRFSIVLQAVKAILHILFPLPSGGAIAFVLSVPMNRIWKRLFANAKEKQKKICRARQPDSDVDFVLALLSLVTIVVVPELGNTIATLGKTLPEKVPVLMKKAEQLVSNHPELVDYIDEVQAQLNWEEILNQLVTFFRIGANSMLSLYHQRSDRNCERRGDVFHRPCFRLLYPVAAGISEAADEKADFRLSEGKARKPFSANLCADVSHIFKFPDRAVPRSGDSGDDVLHFHDDSAVPLCCVGWGADCIYGTDSHFRAFIGCVVGAFLILTISPSQAAAFIVLFIVLQQIEGNLIYPKVVGGSIGLPAIWVLVAVTLGGSLFGIVGMLVFIPIVSVVYTLLKENVNQRLSEKNIKID